LDFAAYNTSFMRLTNVGLRIGSVTDPTVALDVTGEAKISTDLTVTAKFGCNGKAAQAAYAAGAYAAPGAGAYGGSSAANFAAFVANVQKMHAALLANGIIKTA
jgi:hypothetical protein